MVLAILVFFSVMYHPFVLIIIFVTEGIFIRFGRACREEGAWHGEESLFYDGSQRSCGGERGRKSKKPAFVLAYCHHECCACFLHVLSSCRRDR